jgi:hypothetical protein
MQRPQPAVLRTGYLTKVGEGREVKIEAIHL